MSILNKIARFFEEGDLVPFAVLISVYHFAMALINWGENLFVAVAQGLLVDMLHFRTVRQAVRTKTVASRLVAVVTTFLSFGVHLLFYSYHDGIWNITPTAVFLASMLPLSIPVLAWLNEADHESAIVKKLKEALNTAKGELNTVKDLLKVSEGKLNVIEGSMKTVEDKLKRTEGNLADAKLLLKTSEDERRKVEEALKHLGPLGKAMVLDVMTGKVSGASVAKTHGVSEATVSNLKSKLNGAG